MIQQLVKDLKYRSSGKSEIERNDSLSTKRHAHCKEEHKFIVFSPIVITCKCVKVNMFIFLFIT